MEILKFDSGQSKKSRRGRAGYVSILAAGLFVAAIGSTFAASITINSNLATEYGQGVSSTVTCTESLIVIPANKFINTPNDPAFRLLSLTASDTATASTTTGLGKCIGKALKFTAYPNSGDTPVTLYNDTNTDNDSISCKVKITGYSASALQGEIITTGDGDCGTATFSAVGSTGFKVTWDGTDASKLAVANTIAVITVESEDVA